MNEINPRGIKGYEHFSSQSLKSYFNHYDAI